MPRPPSHRAAPRVAVVGAGAAGLFSARALASRGAAVVVLDAAAPRSRQSASAVAAGMLSPFGEHVQEPLGAHPRLLEAGVESLRRWREEEGALAPTRGALILAEDGERARRLNRVIAVAKEFGCSARLLSRRERESLEPNLKTRASLCVRLDDEARLRPRPALTHLARQVEALGGAVRRRWPVSHIEPLGRGLRLDSAEAGERIEADAVLLAPGAWIDEPMRTVAPELSAITPCRGQLLRVNAAGAALTRLVRLPDLYLAPSDDVIVVGATMEMEVADVSIDPATADRHLAAATAALPGLDPANVTIAEAGVRAMTPDWAPMVGPSRTPGVFLACGMSRNGWLLGPLVGEVAAKSVRDESLGALEAAFAPARFAA